MIPLFKVHTPADLGHEIQRVFDEGTVTEGAYSDKFEKDFSSYVENPFTSLVNSGTSALTLAYRMSDVGPGDEVITTPMTCMATNEPIHTAGARIVFADINPETGNICPESIKRRLTKKTKAIVGVHWAGQPFDIDAVTDVAKCYNSKIRIIEDAAHAVGALYKGKRIGSHSDFTCFSFQAIKHMTTVDGGAICSKTLSDDQRIKRLRWFGLDRKYQGSKWEQDIEESGYKFHMNNVNAAIGLAQMPHLPGIVLAHKKNGKYYDNNIKNTNHVRKLKRDEFSETSCWIYSILVDNIEKFKKHMIDREIACDVVHVRNDRYSVFREFAHNDLPGVDEFCSHMVNIPVGWWLTESDVRRVVEAVNDY